MSRRFAAPASLWLLLLLVAPAPAAAFVRSAVPYSDVCLWWGPRQLSFTVNELGTEAVALPQVVLAVRGSFATWEAVECSDLAFVELGTSSSRQVGYRPGGANENLLLFRELACSEAVPPGDPCGPDGSCANEYDCWDFDDGVIGVTTTTFNEATGELVDADIEFNARAFGFTVLDGPPCDAMGEDGCVATDLANTATHEIGHFLGLDHTPEAEATMFASAPLGETEKRSLEADDIAGLCAIYPAGGPTSVCAPRGGDQSAYSDGCGCAAGEGGGSGVAGWALLAAAVLLRHRGRSGDPGTAPGRGKKANGATLARHPVLAAAARAKGAPGEVARPEAPSN